MKDAGEFIERWSRELELRPEEELFYHKDTKRRYRVILSLIPREGNLRILDVGTGPGFLAFLLKKWCGCEVYGLDVKILRRKHLRSEGIGVRKCNVERDEFPFKSRFFDYVICSEVLEHLMYSPFHMLREIRRVLKERGTLILTTPNGVKLVVRLKMLLGKPLQNYRNFYRVAPCDRHNKEYTAGEIRQLLEECGFEVRKVFFRNFTPLRGPLYPGSTRSARILATLCLLASAPWPSLREDIVVEARKR